MKVIVDTADYRNAWGTAPFGFGTWRFELSSPGENPNEARLLEVVDLFPAAKRAAVKSARFYGISNVKVCT